MDTDIVSGIRQALQDVVAPEVQQIKGKIEALDARLIALEKVQDAKFAEVNAKLDALLSIHSIEIRLAKLEARSA